jgi:hypothetical protein
MAIAHLVSLMMSSNTLLSLDVGVEEAAVEAPVSAVGGFEVDSGEPSRRERRLNFWPLILIVSAVFYLACCRMFTLPDA